MFENKCVRVFYLIAQTINVKTDLMLKADRHLCKLSLEKLLALFRGFWFNIVGN